ncbi:putative protein with zinc-binding domain, present in Dystrophin, CREB-binding protein [Lyophyllum shimeji]|uniref:Uncharacterized protein n=1 Tax=Lyophyllum shimeji TaxID=47721 RepID=A0A9P3PTS7_LYOSH|nr:putative protein with zinc-binding domain, present in Dystrophin, CREB-binding protein [Lyophyllum shimeji]
MYNRPDRPLVVKCSLDTWNKKITFSSARNCTYDVLRRKVEQCYSLSSTSFAIAYKDDDGEITTIATDADLTEAIQYFQAGDDAPLSSAASILSGRSFGSRKVTLRVHITVDYDGPSLSDTGSLVSLDEYRGRNGSQQSFSFGSPSVELDDDSVTVSSKDNSAAPSSSSAPGHRLQVQNAGSIRGSDLSRFTLVSHSQNNSRTGESQALETSAPPDPFSDRYEHAASQRYPEDPSAVFERLKLQEELGSDRSSLDFDSLARSDRGAAWLRDQNERTIRSMLGVLPEPSVSDDVSLAPQTDEELGGDLSLERDPRGRYYYTYTSVGSSASQIHDSGYEDGLSGPSRPISTTVEPPRPTSMQLNWLASQQIQPQDDARLIKTSPSVPSLYTSNSDPLPFREYNSQYHGISPHFIVDKELLQFLPPTVPPPESLTDCSECGILLDTIRYVCSTCGEKHPVGDNPLIKGKGRALNSPSHTYPPQPALLHPLSSSPLTSTSSQTYVGSTESLLSRYKPLPTVPSSPTLARAGVPSLRVAESGTEERTAATCLSREGLGHSSWEDVEQDEDQISKCSTCQAITPRKRYKCFSCPNINLCRACYSQVHELHPSHAFLAVPDKRVRSHSDPDFLSSTPPSPNEEQSLKHPGVRCAHCLLDIVGARFHCAICDSVDICSNCEAAGLPGNLDSADGGHNSSHILIKIPYPLETTELEIASRRAIHLWTGRDAASVGLPIPRSKPSSVVSSYARTVVGTGPRLAKTPSDDHHLLCSECSRPIIGIRYQCANCPSSPRAYNLCDKCERRSYIVHDPKHIFFKLPRPVQRPIESSLPMVPVLYREPVGPQSVTMEMDPTAYLTELIHQSSVCDRCMTIIVGAWFRCAYCARDLCDACEEVDTHHDKHVFLVFKSLVDMNTFKSFANLESPDESPPVIPYPVYR